MKIFRAVYRCSEKIRISTGYRWDEVFISITSATTSPNIPLHGYSIRDSEDKRKIEGIFLVLTI